MTKIPHKHAEVIRAWANGETIEYRTDAGMKWTETNLPAWALDNEYRVKSAREYPKTQMTNTEMQHEYDPAAWIAFESMVKIKKVVNAALRHAIDNGQVVTREEFAIAIGDRDKRDWIVAEEVKRACILTLGWHTGQHHHSQTVLRGLSLAPIVEGIRK